MGFFFDRRYIKRQILSQRVRVLSALFAVYGYNTNISNGAL